MRGRRVGEGGYDGEESYGRGDHYFSLGRKNYWRGEDCMSDCLIFLVWEFDFGGFWNQKQGALGCWGFWAWGPGYPYGILELGSRTSCS
jgi:hypothetical protein